MLLLESVFGKNVLSYQGAGDFLCLALEYKFAKQNGDFRKSYRSSIEVAFLTRKQSLLGNEETVESATLQRTPAVLELMDSEADEGVEMKEKLLDSLLSC